MTDRPVLLPNARHQAQDTMKTGLASLPPKPVSAASARSTLTNTSKVSTIQQMPPSDSQGKPAEKQDGEREVIRDTTHSNQYSTPLAIPTLSTSSQSSSDNMPISSSPAIITPSSSVLGKRPLRETGEPDQSSIPIQDESRIIPILPTPLPSKRFKKGSQARASLVPVEQLPVFPLPPLPVISDPALEKQVFTHQSCFPRRKWRFEDPEDDPSMDYEKLEHVGDSILGMVVTTWLQELKPRLTCGRASVSLICGFVGR